MSKKQSTDQPTILIERKGKIKVFGPIEVVDKEGNRLKMNRDKTTLCGCGKSERWPICDGSHKKWKGPKSNF